MIKLQYVLTIIYYSIAIYHVIGNYQCYIAIELAIQSKALADWLDCADEPEEWMRCRAAAKEALGRVVQQTKYIKVQI